MPEMSEQWLQGQQDLLRDIREELRMSRTQSGMSGGAVQGRTFTQAQAAADRTLSGQWDTLGWSNAYSSVYRSSFVTDLTAMSGLQRAPETLTQHEFQALAGQNMWGRAGTAIAGIIAPNYAASSNALADEIYSNSSRFIRFGSNAAGVMGTGFDYGVSRGLSRSIGLSALSDLRMSQADYSTVASLGMQSGQFDSVGSSDEFKSKVKELASATGDLTRALHMTVQEVGTAMGNMRMLGVTNVGQQKQMIMQAGTAAMVAGMSAPEMFSVGGNVATQGMAFGLGPASTFGLGVTNMAMVRNLSAQGIVGQNLIAMGGGASAIAANMSTAQMAFAASNAGLLTHLGGNGANSIQSMMAGLGKVGGSFEDMISMGYDKVKNLSSLSSGDINDMYVNRITSQLQMLGINDMTGRSAQSMAYRMAHGMGMDETAAHVFAQANFSADGIRGTESSRMLGHRAMASRSRAVDYDKYTTANSFAGKVRAGVQSVEAAFGGAYNQVADFFDVGQGSGFASDYAAVRAGVLPGSSAVSLDMYADLFASGGGMLGSPSALVRDGSLGMSGAAASAYTVATRALGPYVGLGAGLASSASGLSNLVISGKSFSDPKAVEAVARMVAASKGGSSVDAQLEIASGIYKGKQWEALTSNLNLAGLTPDAYVADAVNVAKFAEANNTSIEKVQAVRSAVGVELASPDVLFTSGDGGVISTGTKNIEAILGSSPKTSNFSSPQNARALQQYLIEVQKSGSVSSVSAEVQAGLVKAAGSKEAFARMQASLHNMITGDMSKLSLTERVLGSIAETMGASSGGKHNVPKLAGAISELNGVIQTGTNAALNETFGAATDYATDLISSRHFNASTADPISKELQAIKAGDANFMTALSSGKLGEAARGGKLGNIFQSAASVMTDKDIMNKNQMQLAKEYHVSASAKQIEQAKSHGEDYFRRAVGSAILGERAIGQESSADMPMKTAQVLKQAADTLDRMNQVLNVAK